MDDDGRDAELCVSVREAEDNLEDPAAERLTGVDDGGSSGGWTAGVRLPQTQWTTDLVWITAGIVWSISLRSLQGDQFVT